MSAIALTPSCYDFTKGQKDAYESMWYYRERYGMQLHLQPVYSLLVEPNALPQEIKGLLPPGMHLSVHQLETYNILKAKTHAVAMNTAMTGDGKSLAMYLSTLLQDRHRTFAMYPTIELSRDQQKQFRTYASLFNRTVSCEALWGARLGDLARERSAKRRGEILKERLTNYQVILTNPDIFHLMMNYRYGSNIYSDQELPYTLSTFFDDFLFDEFHVFSMPQIVATLTAMLFFLEYSPDEAPRFLFSSATPDPLFLHMMDRAGIPFYPIHGTYRMSGGEHYRQVLHPSTLTLHACGGHENVEEWLGRNLNIITTHWQHANQRPKGAIILNSVVTARRVAKLLATQLSPYGIDVGEVTGLVEDDRTPAVMEQADLVVGTSTIDVGIDFHISLLIFETLDAGNFLQRLGRLGRVRMQGLPFDHYEAHVLISSHTPWIYERFVQCFQERGIHDGDAIDRPETLRSIVTDPRVFPQATQFLPYAKRWGILQAAHVITMLQERSREGSFQSLAEALQKRYEAVFQVKDFGHAIRRYHTLTRKKSTSQETQQCKELLDEVLSFRGTSPFHTAVWDSTTTHEAFIGYDTLPLVQNARYEVIPQQTYTTQLERYAQSVRESAIEEMRQAMKGKDNEALILHITEFVQDREALLLGWEGVNLRDWTRQVIALRGCFIQAPCLSRDFDRLNSFLRRQWLICYLTRKDSAEIRRELRLPPYFPLYLLEQSGKNYTVTFGKAALLLEAELLRSRGKDEEEEAIFC